MPNRFLVAGVAALTAGSVIATGIAPGRAGAAPLSRPIAVPGLRTERPGCALATPRPGYASCLEILVTGSGDRPLSSSTIGYTPSQLRAAYGLTTFSKDDGGGKTVAVIEAYNDPDDEADLATYRAQFKLPACGSGCFTVVNEQGQSSPLPTENNQGWAGEQSLDMDMVSAICPKCHILVVEANNQSDTNLGTAEDTASRLGANAISNSFGSPEKAADLAYDKKYFDHPGIAVTAGSGDSGFGVSYPAASPYVTAVGGTHLTKSSNTRGWTESAWIDGGSGCSIQEPKPSWQTNLGCSFRTTVDVAFDADPYTGVAVYDSDCSLQNFENGKCYPGWGLAGGTSIGAPAIASVYAVAGNTATVDGANTIYANTSDLYDVTSGSNGTCTPTYLCTAGPGYDGPTGWGTPNGIGAF